MNPLLAKRCVELVRARDSEGDYPTTEALPAETLEFLVIHLANQLEAAQAKLAEQSA